MTLLLCLSLCLRHSSSPGLSLYLSLSSTLPGPSASEVTTLWRYKNRFIIIILLILCLLAIVTLKHGEEAEAAVSELSDVPLRGFDVEISLYRSDNLLCVTSLPSTLCCDDAAFKMFAETFGPVEKCFLMRASSGLCYQDFVEAYFMTVHSCLFLMCA